MNEDIKVILNRSELVAIANDIRSKMGNTGEMTFGEIKSSISGFETGLDTSDATATMEDITVDKSAYVNGEKIIGTNPYSKAETDAAVDEQTDLIAQIKSTADALPEATSGGSIDTFNFTLNGGVVFALVNNCWVFPGESTLLPYIIGSENTLTPSMSGYSITMLLTAFASFGTDISITVNGVTLDNSNLEIVIIDDVANQSCTSLSILNTNMVWYNAGDEVIITLS